MSRSLMRTNGSKCDSAASTLPLLQSTCPALKWLCASPSCHFAFSESRSASGFANANELLHQCGRLRQPALLETYVAHLLDCFGATIQLLVTQL